MANHYSPSEYIKTVYSLILTKLSFSQARLIRHPIYIRGKKSIEGANGLTTGRFCRFDLEGKKKTLIIGENCEFGDFTHIVALNHVQIGNDVLIASKCFISDTNHGSYSGEVMSEPEIPPQNRKLVSSNVDIGNDVWIGENVVILAGGEIGSGCIIGANSVVKGKVPKNTIVAGAPARIVKYWDDSSNKWKKYTSINDKK